MSLKIYAHGNSITGRVRKLNEDSFNSTSSKGVHGSLFVVCDGVGGHKAGEIASRYASKKLSQYFFKSSQDNISIRLKEAIKQINNDIYQASQKDNSKKGMGTTVVAAYLFKNKLYLANVGDSRAYLIRNSTIKKLTTDHSWVEEKVKEGVITRTEARIHPKKNVITRCIGYDYNVEVDTYIYELKEGDRIILCTDGLWDELNDLEIKKILSESRNIKDAISNLIKEANIRGGKDNITCVGIDYGKFKSYVLADKKIFAIIGLSVLSLVLVIALIYFLINPITGPDDQTEIDESVVAVNILEDETEEDPGETGEKTAKENEEDSSEEEAIVEEIEEEEIKEEVIEEEKKLEEYKDVTVADAKELIDNNPDLIIILDVSSKYDDSHIPGAINYGIDDGSLDSAILKPDTEAIYLVYSHDDETSNLGAQKLIEAGFKNVYRLEGNYAAWIAEGYKVESALIIKSPEFNDGEMIPVEFICDADNAVNPPLDISGVPQDAKSLVLIVEDPDVPDGTGVHWIVWNIDPTITSISKNSVPLGGVEGATDFLISGYVGPCPSSGTHYYFFKLFALDNKLDPVNEPTVEDIMNAMNGHKLATAKLIGLYEKN